MDHLFVLDFPHQNIDGKCLLETTMAGYDRFYRKCALAYYHLRQATENTRIFWEKQLADTRFDRTRKKIWGLISRNA